VKVDWLKLARYRNLRDFEIDFDEAQSTTVVLGQNGTGKSNLIEALVEIFRELELESLPTFGFQLQYICRKQTIRFAFDPTEQSSRVEILVDGQSISHKEFNRRRDELLPNYVFAYYSGWSSRLESHFTKTTRAHYKALLTSSDRKVPLRRMFFCRREYSQLVLLAFFLKPTLASTAFLKKYLGIVGLESALFVLKRPDWAKSGKSRGGSDPRFWNARGAFRGFLDQLWRSSVAPVRRTEVVERDIRRAGERTERQYLYIQDEETLRKLAGGQNAKPAELFGYLEGLFLCDLVDEVRVNVRKEDGMRVGFAQLSEGEQQLLTVLGLMLFTKNDEALYLLDEPDTHLNPVWTYEYLALLEENIRADKGQLIVATHNPLMIGSLHKNQVRVLAQEESRSVAKEPDYDPIGIGVEGLLKSELYGLRSTLAPEVLLKLDRHYTLLGKEHRSEHEEMQLIGLAAELNALGVARTHPNPYFEQFAVAMAKHLPGPAPPQTKSDIDAQARLADDIVAEILVEERAIVERENST
jgi:predicted ATPase